ATIPRAQILNETQGVLKSIVDIDTNKILGCTLLCAQASEMINTIQIAMNAGLDYRAVRDTIFTHPSMTEASMTFIARYNLRSHLQTRHVE
ncbi:MAG TPA: hypothetical protein VNS32_20850, partial [Flavisolibacter sp.]|nr:hypothetical protein [Flavisolibacter sp.]